MSEGPWILGLSCSHNASACLLHGDHIVAAIQDERLLRYKRQRTSARFIRYCVNYCLGAAAIQPRDLNLIVCSSILGSSDRDVDDIWLNDYIRAAYFKVPLLTITHHLAHAVSAFATSGFRDAATLVIDGSGTRFECLTDDEQAVVLNDDARAGDWEWLSYYESHDTVLRPVFKQVLHPHTFDQDGLEHFGSIGHMYAAVADLLFGDFLDAPGKVMGLAPYGTATFPVDQWLTVEDGGLVRFSPEGLREAKRRCRDERDLPARADVAASVQRATEYALINIVHKIRAMSASTNLCYAGGVALNSVANELLVRQSGFEQVYIFPAAEDSGVSVGAAYYGLWQLEHHNTRQRVRHDAMGRIYDGGRIDRAISSTPAVSVRRSSNIASDVARLLCHGEVVGWFDGRSELGPRALGQRTILYDPRRSDGKEILNRRVKHREMFRPFAPVILRDHAQDWFDVAPEEQDSPFMLRVWTFLGSKATLVPAVAHVDNTARVQTITRDVQPLLFDVLSAFFAETGVPLLLNTSYNVAGEPIVETPEDALFCLMSTGIDCCIFDDRIVRKQEGFKSLLDLRPRISAKAIMADLPVVAGCVMASADDAAVAPSPWQDALIPFEPSAMWHVRDAVRSRSGSGSRMAYGLVQTEWGDVAVLIPEQYFRLLTKIDGICDGHALLDTTCGWSEKWLLTALAGLYRASLIRFSCASLSATEGKSTD